MRVVFVHIQIKPEFRDAFIQATNENAEQSRKEPGIQQFDLLQKEDDVSRFVLLEVYKTPEAPAAHKETAHYAKWRDTVASMMAEPRHGEWYHGI